MKHIDVTDTVMQNVASFEKKRSILWFTRFFFVVIVFLGIGGWVLSIAVSQILERQTLDLLTLITQDREIITEFWQDTLMVFWEELPQAKLLLVGIIITCVILLVLLTKKRRMIVWKRLQDSQKIKEVER